MPERHPLNAPGPFYVKNDMCISCAFPQICAPDLMCSDDELERDGHCYFKKQPYSAGEFEQALLAIDQSCCGALRYGGNDPLVREMMARRGLENYCDD